MSALEETLLAHMVAAGVAAPEREVVFAPPRRWRFDFAWPERRVAVEVEGGTWVGGGHSRGRGFASDVDKYNAAVLGGWRVLRVTSNMVRDGRALALVERALEELT